MKTLRLICCFLFLSSLSTALAVEPKRAVIIGSGITGLTAGILLKQQGWQVKIYEKRGGIEHIGGALSIWPNGSKVLLDLPCAAEIADLKGDLRFEKWGDTDGNTLMTVDRDMIQLVNGSPFMNICRSELQQVLFTTFGPEDVVFNAECTELVEGEKGVHVHFRNEEIATADLVIGADGVHSKIRQGLFPEAHLDYAGYVALVGIFKFPHGDQPKNHIIWGKNRYFLDFSVSGGRDMIYATLPLPRGQLKERYKTKEQQIALFSGWSPEVDRELALFLAAQDDPEYAQHYFCNENYDMKPLAAWHKGRVVLLGDAAHPMGSMFGLAANLALEDAHELAHRLATTDTLEQALIQFEETQSPRAKRFAEMEIRDKRQFLLHGTEEDLSQFHTFLKSGIPFRDLFSSIFETMAQPRSSALGR